MAELHCPSCNSRTQHPSAEAEQLRKLHNRMQHAGKPVARVKG